MEKRLAERKDVIGGSCGLVSAKSLWSEHSSTEPHAGLSVMTLMRVFRSERERAISAGRERPIQRSDAMRPVDLA